MVKKSQSKYATTLHLSRILLFLEENRGYHVKRDIANGCCMSIPQAQNGLNFLIKFLFVNKFQDGALTVYSLNKMRKSKEDLRELNKKQYLKHKDKISSIRSKKYRDKKAKEKKNGTR